MLRIKVAFDYTGEHTFENLDWEWFRNHWPSELPEKKPSYSYSVEELAVNTTSELARELSKKVKILLTPLNESLMWVKMLDRKHGGGQLDLESYEDGSTVQITIPDMGLLIMNEVTWRDDACTEEIQELLDKGWRILAVCPPNASRRPDYILGRSK